MMSYRNLIWIASFMFVSCARESTTSSAKYQTHRDEVENATGEDDVGYLEKEKMLLIYKVFEKSWVIALRYSDDCFEDEDEKTKKEKIERLREAVKQSVLTWIEPLREIVATNSGSDDSTNMGSEPHQERRLIGYDDIHVLPFSDTDAHVFDPDDYTFTVYAPCSGYNGSFDYPRPSEDKKGTYDGHLSVDIGTGSETDDLKSFQKLHPDGWITEHIHEYILLHEIGHIFGLGHSEKKSAVMSKGQENPKENEPRRDLYEDDHPIILQDDRNGIVHMFKKAFPKYK